jgi:hypothetical protein
VALSPEERELHSKRQDLEKLEGVLAERELELATLRAELRAFDGVYFAKMAPKFARHDELVAQIAEARARRAPASSYVHARAADARRKAQESAEAATAAITVSKREFRPSEHLKGMFRDIAKRIHPDLATDDTSRAKRTELMAKANRAYEEGDEQQLRAVLDEWESSPDAITGDGVAPDLIRTIRKIHQVTQRLPQIEAEIIELKSSDSYRLRNEVEAAKRQRRDLLGEMAYQLDTENTRLEGDLQTLLSMEVSS